MIQMRMDNTEKQLNSKMNGLYGSLEEILKGELKKCMKETQENIDLEIAALKAPLEQLEVKLRSSSSSPNKFNPDVSSLLVYRMTKMKI